MNKILVVFIVFVQALVTYSFANGTQVTKGGFAVQNTDAALSADITIEFINPDGSREHQIARTIAPHSSLFIDLDSPNTAGQRV